MSMVALVMALATVTILAEALYWALVWMMSTISLAISTSPTPVPAREMRVALASKRSAARCIPAAPMERLDMLMADPRLKEASEGQQKLENFLARSIQSRALFNR